MIRVRTKQSKIDSIHQGVDIYLGRMDIDICPVKAILPYLAIRGSCPGPLFIQEDGRMLMRQNFSSIVKLILARLKLPEGDYNIHSFCIGTATAAIEAQIPVVLIKMLGHCCSDAYQIYMNTTGETCQVIQEISIQSHSLRTRQITPSKPIDLVHYKKYTVQ